MKILYLAHRIPFPPNKGEKIRAWRQLAFLGERHDVWCAGLTDQHVMREHIAALSAICRDVAVVPRNRKRATAGALRSLAMGSTITEGYFHSRKLCRILDEWSRRVEFDLVVAFSSSMAPYALNVPARRRVLDFCDVDSRKWSDYADRTSWPLRVLYAMEARRLARRERSWLSLFDASLVITKHEAAAFDGLHGADRLHVIANGVDANSDPSDPRASSGPIVGFIGALDYLPNVDGIEWFANDIWPSIRHVRPDAVLRIVGHAPCRRVKRLAAVPGVEVIGPVDCARPAVASFDVSIAPLRIARGLQNKVLEAMAAGKPVVVTSAVARGIEAHDDADYLVADDAPAFALRVLQLLGDHDHRARIGAAARQFVFRHHAWGPILAAYERIVTGVLDSRTAFIPRATRDIGSSTGSAAPEPVQSTHS
jgi:sugar transferase (PEP-CTERM/EpsH1 system associated)